MLEIKDLTIQFGGLKAVQNFNLNIGENEIVGLIGPNGAGKTTIFNAITGVRNPTSGEIYYNHKDISKMKPYMITQNNIARTFQNIRLFSNLTVLDNIKISYSYCVKYNLIDAIFKTSRYFKEEKTIEENSMELLKTFGLQEDAYELADNLPYGKQRRVEIARALAANPTLLLLDEPAAGMNPQETKELTELIGWIREKFGVSILLIEHDMKLVMNICDKIAVLDYGKKIAEGTPSEIKNNNRVIEAYLGEASDEEEVVNA